MKRKLLVASTIVVACLIALGLAARYDPTHIVVGLLRNEAFFRGYPTSYWREVIGAEGRAGVLDINTVLRLDDADAVPVLLECLADPDPNVRWPSLILLRRAGPAWQVEPALRGALDDADLDVRLRAIHELARLGPEAMPSVPKLVELDKDDDWDMSIAVQYALWAIDPETARTAGGWQEFTSVKWQFSVTMPGPPKEEDRFIDTPYGEVPLHGFAVSYGVAYCIVAVTEYSEHSLRRIEESSVEDRYDFMAHETAAHVRGSLVRYDPIEQHGYSGREWLIEVEEEATSHTRVFLVGPRMYQIGITYPPGVVVSPRAEEFFLGSLRITYVPGPAAEETNSREAPRGSRLTLPAPEAPDR